MSGRVRANQILAMGCMVLAALMAGCDTKGSTAVGPPPAAPPSEAPSIAVILPAAGIAELDVWEQSARRMEAKARTMVEVYRLQPGEPDSKQVDLIKEAVGRAPSAILIVAADPRAVAPALAEARDAGIAVVTLDRAVPVDGKPFPIVQYKTERESAGDLVAAAVEDAKAGGFPPGGPAILLINGPADDHAKARRQAMREALEGAGVRVLPDVVFTGMSEPAEAALKLAILTNPMVSMVLTDEDRGLSGALRVRHGLDHSQKRFVLAGYTADRSLVDMARTNVFNAVVDRNIGEPMDRALEIALALIRGETVPSRIEVVTPLVRASGPPDEGRISGFLGKPVPTALPTPR